MRVGELAALMWSDINFAQQTITISKTYYNPNNNTVKYQLLPPKTKGARRIIVVEDIVMEELKEHKKAQDKSRNHYDDLYHQMISFSPKEKDIPDIQSVLNRSKTECTAC